MRNEKKQDVSPEEESKMLWNYCEQHIYNFYSLMV